MTPDKNLVDKAVEAVFNSDLLVHDGRDNDLALQSCECYSHLGSIDVRKLVTLILSVEAVTPIADALEQGRRAYSAPGSVIDDNPYETLDRQFFAWMVGWELERERNPLGQGDRWWGQDAYLERTKPA